MTDAKYSLTPADRVEIHELPGRYGDAIDDRNWDALDTVFTEDAVFDLTGVGSRICEGLMTSSRLWNPRRLTRELI